MGSGRRCVARAIGRLLCANDIDACLMTRRGETANAYAAYSAYSHSGTTAATVATGAGR